MLLLLDARALLWWLAGDPGLDRVAARSIADPTNDIVVSAATVWEIEVKRAAGRLTAPEDLPAELDRTQIDVVPFTAPDAVAAAWLPAHHRDPFDRMLVAQAVRLAATIVSRDRVLDSYGVARLPA